MTDIVERLESYEAERDPDVSDEAANEIRRLRGLLREMVNDKNTYLRPDWHKRVREALGHG